MDHGVVDVIIPTYNRREMLLKRALPSVLHQTYGRLRVIVAVHGSTDGTMQAVRDHYCYDSRVYMINVPRVRRYPPTAENHWFAGPVDPLNAALDCVKGDWIARIDDDDIWYEDHLELLMSHASENSLEFVSSVVETNVDENEPYKMPDGTLIGGCQTWLYRSYLRFFRYNRDCWRKSWNKVNDCDLQERMWRAGVRMGYLDDATCYVKPRPGEESVGLAAYVKNRDNTERAYAF